MRARQTRLIGCSLQGYTHAKHLDISLLRVCCPKLTYKLFAHAHTLRMHMQVRDVLTRRQIFGINRKLQIKPRCTVLSSNGVTLCTEALLIMKWGGDLTAEG